MRVRIPLRVLFYLIFTNNKNLAYIVGVAIGDGNLSNPNGRAVRLRITCDLKYPQIIKRIKKSLSFLLPNNKVSIINRAATYCDVSCYSNLWEELLGWRAKGGPKYKQKVKIPAWIKSDTLFMTSCLRGLFETDGSIYYDRDYKMVNFVTVIPDLAHDVSEMIKNIGFQSSVYTIKTKTATRYNIRISKDVDKFIKTINLKKK